MIKKEMPSKKTRQSSEPRVAHYIRKISNLNVDIATQGYLIDECRQNFDPQRAFFEMEKAALEAEKAVFEEQRNYLLKPETLWLYDCRNKYGTGQLFAFSRHVKGSGYVVNFVEGSAITSCPFKHFKLEGDEVTCDRPRKVVRRWHNGIQVPALPVPRLPKKGPRE